MEVLKNLLTGLMAGDLGLWALLVILALFVWVVLDATILARGIPRGICDRVEDLPMTIDGESSSGCRSNDEHANFFGVGVEPIGYIGVGAHRHRD